MHSLKISALLIFLAVAVCGHAQELRNSQFMHQTDSGKFELTPSLTFGSMTYNYGFINQNYSNGTDSMLGVNLAAEYGIDAMISVGVRLGFQNDSYSFHQIAGSQTNTSTRGSGLVDPDFFINFRNDVGVGILRYGANLSFSLGDATGGENHDSINGYTGGLTFTPYVGYEYAFGKNEVGARISYDVIQTDRTWKTLGGDSSKIRNGNEFTLAAYYEYNWAPVLLGVDVGDKSYSSTSVVNSAETVSNLSNYDTGFLEVYGAWTIVPDYVLIPRLGYNTLDTGSEYGRIAVAGTKSSGGPFLDVAFRMTF